MTDTDDPWDRPGLIGGAATAPQRVIRVYISKGGSAFHLDAECPWLHKGQSRAARSGLRLHDIESVHREVAEDAGKDECKWCFKDQTRRTS
ncbi:hypothetical protein [Glycomyces paridis]|uniref:Uncharacterized protein n=1 Tax=Glycomyces paridis TaxID=2126555 RepID=A0A4S8PJE6_9ACTN|nr:hypothetical protein [Glycomyces paridis]THV30800.1 hypothetical protein E9998_05325 [Glycomyces paridis]